MWHKNKYFIDDKEGQHVEEKKETAENTHCFNEMFKKQNKKTNMDQMDHFSFANKTFLILHENHPN